MTKSMGTPESWPDRPAFARFRVATVEKADGRHVHYYEWPAEADAGDPEDGDASSGGARPNPTADDDV